MTQTGRGKSPYSKVLENIDLVKYSWHV